MPPTTDVLERLIDATASMTLVKITRSLRNATPVHGFVLAVGSKWVLVAEATDGGYLDGLLAVRVEHITKVKQDPTFHAFAQARPEWPPNLPSGLDLSTTNGVIRGLGRLSPLVGIEQEARYNSPMVWIGAVDSISNGWLGLREVRPNATWRKQPRGYRLKKITKVAIDSRYQQALSTTAGPPPHANGSI